MMIELSDKEARIFRVLVEARALDVSSGSVTIHFDADGIAVQVEVRRFVKFSPPKPLTSFDGILQVVV